MISINNIELDSNLLWSNEFAEDLVSITTTRTIGGMAVNTAMPLVGAKQYVLEAVSSGSIYSGSFTRTQVEALVELKNSASIVAFVYNTLAVNVRIQSTTVVPLIPRPNHEGTDLYTGSIIMIEA